MKFVKLSCAVWAALLFAPGFEALAAPNAYVANSAGNTVTVIDNATATVATTIPVGAGPSRVAANANGSRVYVTNYGGASVSVIDAATNLVISTIPTGVNPTGVAVSKDGTKLFVGVANGVLQMIDLATASVINSYTIGGAIGDIGVSVDGARVYIAAPQFSYLDIATGVVTATSIYTSGDMVLTPNGKRAYVTNDGDIFGSGSSIVAIDLVTMTTLATIPDGSFLGSLAVSPDSMRVYVGIAGNWVNTGYGQGFFPGRHVRIIDTTANVYAGAIDLGADGNNWTQQNTAGRMAVTADRADVYVLTPRLNAVSVASYNTNVVRTRIPVIGGVTGIVAAKKAGLVYVPYVIDAVDDVAPAAIPTTGGTAIANVLANDRIGGFVATTKLVTLKQVSPLITGVTLKATGAITIAAGTPVGAYSIVYEICDRTKLTNCDQATAQVTVREPYAIVANDDAASVNPGRMAVANVLANDTLGGTLATTKSVKLTLVSAPTGKLSLTTGGSVNVAADAAPGVHTLTYKICELISLANCDTAVVRVTVVPIPIDAVDDTGTMTQSGGVAIPNVLANDKFAGLAANLTRVSLSLVSTSSSAITLNTLNGAVSISSGAALNGHSLVYKICELAAPANCDTATASVSVSPMVINAVDDSAKVSSKIAGAVIPNVLVNDRLGPGAATTSNVNLSLVSISPPNPQLSLDVNDGSIDLSDKTESGLYMLVYRICEKANPGNCDTATAALDLSGGL